MKRASYKFSENSIDGNPSTANRPLCEQPKSFIFDENVICSGSSNLFIPSHVSTSRGLTNHNCDIDLQLVGAYKYDNHHACADSKARLNSVVEGRCNANRIKYSDVLNQKSNNHECLWKPNTSAEISVHCKEKKKKKNLIYFIRKKINYVIENCSYKNSSDSNRTKFKKCKSLEVLSNNYLEHTSQTMIEESMPNSFEFKRPFPCLQSLENKQSFPIINSSLKLSSMSVPINEQSLLNIEQKEIDSLGFPLLCKSFDIATQANTNHLGKSSFSVNKHSPIFESILPHFPSVDETCDNQSDNNKILISTNNCLTCEPSSTSSDVNNFDNFKNINEELQTDCTLNVCESSGTEKLTVCKPAILCKSSESFTKSLTEELRELVKYGWYWGSMNRKEAEDKLNEEIDGAFLVRDSSDVKYLYTLSFKSYGKTFHTRIEHSNGWFSFYPQPDNDGHRSLVKLVEHCISESDAGVFCYSRPLLKGSPSFPVRLIKPISRFMKVRSLQYLCRFVIRRYISINNIQNLPAPIKIKRYLEESYY